MADTITDIIPDVIHENKCEIFKVFEDSKDFWSFKDLTIVHMNIQGIKSNFDEFIMQIMPYISMIDIIILTETKFNSSNPFSFSITGFSEYFSSKQFNQNSGIAIFTSSSMNVEINELDNLELTNCIQLNITTNNQTLTLLAIYRSPNTNPNKFIQDLDNYLTHNRKNKMILIGDININILNDNIQDIGHDYLDIVHSHNFIPHITDPTRVQTNKRHRTQQYYTTVSCIDHIMYKDTSRSIMPSTAIIETNITDHYTVAIKLQMNNENLNDRTVIKTYKQINYEKPSEMISQVDWTIITNSTDVDFTAEKLIDIVQNITESCTETRRYTNKLTPLKPWMTQGLLKSIRTRDRLAIQCKQQQNNERLIVYYKKVRKVLSKAIRAAKNLHLKSQIDEHKNNKQKMWKILHEYVNKKKKITQIKKITHQNQIYNCETNTFIASNIMNTHFNNIGKTLSEKIEQNNVHTQQSNIIQMSGGTFDTSDHNHNNTLPDRYGTFSRTTETEIYKHITSLKSKCSPGYDKIESKTLKFIAHYIVHPLTHVINLSLSKGQFPSSYKASIIVPIHKKGKKDDLTNYRPISLLTNFSKILEKTVKERLEHYLTTYDKLTPRQYGFRKKIGTEDALLDLTTYLLNNIDHNKKVIALFLDTYIKSV